MPITVTLEIPEDLAALLRFGGRDLSRAALEALAVEEYRARRLSDAQFRRLLGLSRLQADGLLKAHAFGWTTLSTTSTVRAKHIAGSASGRDDDRCRGYVSREFI